MKKIFLSTLLVLLYAGLGIGSTVKMKFKPVALVETCRVITVHSTVYGANTSECDNTPLITASGKFIDTVKLNTGKLRFIAVAQPMLKKNGGFLSYGDTVTIESDNWRFSGKFIVADCKNKRFKASIDFLKPKHHFKNGKKYAKYKYYIPQTVNIVL